MDKLDYRAIIRFLTIKNIGNNDVHNELLNVYGGEALVLFTVKNWSQQFRLTRKSIHDVEQTGRPIDAPSDENVEQIS